MTILALDTSSRAASCALWQDGELRGEYFLNAGLTHSQTIMPMVEFLLRQCGVALAEVDRFAVSTGPGSFTGLRIGLSAVKGMAMGADKPCVGVSTLACLAENASLFSGIVVPTMDARCGQVYTAIFHGNGGLLTRLEEDCAIPIQELGEKLHDFADSPILLVGDGAVLCRDNLPDLPHLRLITENLRHQRAGNVARIASRCDNTVFACDLEPVYLRLPQAQRELMKKREEHT